MRIVFTGGGSGGHLTPIIAVARELAGFVWSIGQHFPVSNRAAVMN